MFPGIVTHNYHRERGPFRNVCDLPAGQARAVLEEIYASCGRKLKPDYLARRLATERWLLDECARLHGASPRARPVYFFLGNFADGADPMRPHSIVMPLSAFDPATITFTWPDSMASLPLARDAEHAGTRKPWHGRVFTLEGIRAEVARHGMPARLPVGGHSTPDRFIEMQLWDAPPDYTFCQSA